MEKKAPLAAKIKMEMEVQGRSPDYVAASAGMSRNTFFRRMKEPDSLTFGEYKAICKALKLDFRENVRYLL